MTDFNTSGSYYIRDNLKAALLRFRNPEKDVDIWVDALCIDQDNKVEKKAQVARSKSTFSISLFSVLGSERSMSLGYEFSKNFE